MKKENKKTLETPLVEAYVKAVIVKKVIEEEAMKTGKSQILNTLQSLNLQKITLKDSNINVTLVTPKILDEKKAIDFLKANNRTDLITVTQVEKVDKKALKIAVETGDFTEKQYNNLKINGTTQVRTSGKRCTEIKEKSIEWVKKAFKELF
jgi:transcription initiation factor IIF auxiliary subunit